MRFAAFAFILLAAGCLRPNNGDVDASSNNGGPDGHGSGTHPDSGSGSGSGSNPDASVPIDGMVGIDASPFPCKNKVNTSDSGHHNAGSDCAQCHGGEFSVAGTVYTTLTGSTPVSGATVTVTGANGQVVNVVTGLNGNFHTTAAITFPAHVYVSSCPNSQPMSATISSSQGSCNASGACHNGTQGNIHLP